MRPHWQGLPEISRYTLNTIPCYLEHHYWTFPVFKHKYGDLDTPTLVASFIHMVLGCWAVAHHSKQQLVWPLQLLSITVFSTHFLQHWLRSRGTTGSSALTLLAVLSRLLESAALLALFSTLTPEDWGRLFIDPRQQYRLPAWAISASMLCAYSLVHGMLALHHPLPFHHVVWIHLLFLVAGWKTLGSLQVALQHPSLVGVGSAFCSAVQKAALTMLAWGATPPTGLGTSSLPCGEVGEAYLLAFALCSLGCLCPMYLSYRKEWRLKAPHLANMVHDPHQVSHDAQLQQPLPRLQGAYTHAVAIGCLLLVSHTLCEVLLVWS